jgi:hypothetical protein
MELSVILKLLLLMNTKFSSMRDQWIRDGDGFVLLFSVTNRATLEETSVFMDSHENERFEQEC